jgi:hypothetical protein
MSETSVVLNTAADAAAAAAAAVPAAAVAAPWYGDKVDATTIGFWQNKGIDPADPVAVATKMTEFYRHAEGKIGAPPEEMLRIPKSNAAEIDIKAYWGKIGVPAEAKDYDLSAVKMDTAFSDALREALLHGRVPKDRAGEVATRLIKFEESKAAAALAERTAIIKAETEQLEKNWGVNKLYNEQIAKRALEDLGRATGMTPEQASKAWDALSQGTGIGAARAAEMLRIIGAKMGEPSTLITGDKGNAGSQVMSKDQAKAQIESLKKDKGFYKRLVTDKEAAARREWDDLHKIAYAA